jgi:uncharacterized protein YcbX
MSSVGRVCSLYRYPVKGLSGEPLSAVALDVGSTFPMDRAYALENGPSGFDPIAPTWQPKVKFLCLMRNARLASFSTRYSDDTQELTVVQGEKILAKENLATESGRHKIEKFFENFMAEEKRGPIRVLKAPNHSFSDVAKKVVSLINLSTLADLEDRLGQPIHFLRFRANIYIDGFPAWSEFDLVGKTVQIGSTGLRIVKRIERCAAIDVNPETALRDLDIPEILCRLRDNADLGVYTEVITEGRIAEGDAIRVIS